MCSGCERPHCRRDATLRGGALGPRWRVGSWPETLDAARDNGKTIESSQVPTHRTAAWAHHRAPSRRVVIELYIFRFFSVLHSGTGAALLYHFALNQPTI